MRKAITTGLLAGVVLAIIFIAISYSRIVLPSDSNVANITFLVIILACVVITLWLAMSRYSKYSPVRWSHLNLISVVAGITTAILFSGASFLIARFAGPDYLARIIGRSGEQWFENNSTAQYILGQGDWLWFSDPLSFALTDFRIVLTLLIIISLFIAFIYYSRNKHRLPYHGDSNNHELIF